MVKRQQSANRVFEMLFDAIEQRGESFATVSKEYGLGSPGVLVQCWNGRLMIPVSFLPGIARFLNVDPAWLLRIYLEDHLPDTMRMIEQCGLSMIVTEKERELLLAYRSATADQDPPTAITTDGHSVFDAQQRAAPGEDA